MGKEEKASRSKIRSFEDLDAWKVCREVRREMFKLAAKLPPAEKYRLSDQLIRASRSATANLAEGYGRYHFLETMRFCRQARGSLYELLDHLTVAVECGYITGDEAKGQERQILKAIQVINGLVRYLRGRKHQADA